MPQLSRYYLAESFHELYNAGIVRKNQEAYLQSAGFKPISFKYGDKQQSLYKLFRIIQCVAIALSLPSKSLVIFHFPFQATVYKLLLSLLKWRGIQTAVLIIDIDGIRDKNETELQQEVLQLKKFNTIVAHNDTMKRKLLELIPGANIICIEIFDYPFTGVISKKTFSNTVCFAGNIAKSGFTKSLGNIASVQFNIYGIGYDAVNTNSNVIYKGAINASELPAQIEGSFGLVWDGDSTEYCDAYLRYNNPHKFSLYLLTGMPVIVWKESALAKLVQEKNIGILINTLDDVHAIIINLSPEAYSIMQSNAAAIGKDIREEKFIQKVITTILN